MFGMNLCLFGIGSKQKVAEAFVDRELKDQIVLKIIGSSASVKVENILMKLLQTLEPFMSQGIEKSINKIVGKKRPSAQDILEELKKLLHQIQKFGIFIYILFLDIDGKNFRELSTHTTLSLLLSYPNIRLVATLSNSSFQVLLTKEVMIRYNFCFQAVNTYEAQELEMMADELSWFNQKESKGTNAIKSIYTALTENQKAILRLLAEHLCKSTTGQISFNDFFELTIDEMLTTSAQDLQEHLKEAIIHGVRSFDIDCY